VLGFSWNFNKIIWHLYVFDFAHLENFPATGGFLGAENRKNGAGFSWIFWNGQLVRNFLCNECFREKSSEVFFLLVGWLTFISAQFWNFPTFGSAAISGFPEITYFSGVYPGKSGNLFFWFNSSLEDDLWRKNQKNVYIFINISKNRKTAIFKGSGFS
jgi:hypothetical protein